MDVQYTRMWIADMSVAQAAEPLTAQNPVAKQRQSVKLLCQQLGQAIASLNWQGLRLWRRCVNSPPGDFSLISDAVLDSVAHALGQAVENGPKAIPVPSVLELDASLQRFCNGADGYDGSNELKRRAASQICDHFVRALAHPITAWKHGNRQVQDDSLEKFQHEVLVQRECWLESHSNDTGFIPLSLQTLGQTAITISIVQRSSKEAWFDAAIRSWSREKSNSLSDGLDVPSEEDFALEGPGLPARRQNQRPIPVPTQYAATSMPGNFGLPLETKSVASLGSVDSRGRRQLPPPRNP